MHHRARTAVCLALLTGAVWLGMAQAAEAELTYEQARQAASQDEAKLDGEQVATLAEAQADFMKRAIRKCTARVPRSQLTPVGMVMELDATGRVVRTWLDTDTAVATCLSDAVKTAVFYVPPKAPFLTSMDMSWSN